jgi:hypothetical protein
VHWKKRSITYANLQALWSETPLNEFLGGTCSEHRYLRLDYDLSSLGPLLKESQPHVHVEADGEPRFMVPSAVGDDVVGWFLDFVYRNFFYDDWIFWAKEQWEQHCLSHNRENRWERLEQAFQTSKPEIIEGDPKLRQDLADLKACVLAKRKGLFPLCIAAPQIRLFAHDR